MKTAKWYWITAWIFIGIGGALILIPLAIVLAQYFTYDSAANSAPAAVVFLNLCYTVPFGFIGLSFGLVLFPRMEENKKGREQSPG
jgi:peptidoglycan biosynthesis protein MviN/MurJ (putative lipid II flippase)